MTNYRKQAEVVPGLIVNPGSGPVEEDTSPEAAAFNMTALVADLEARGATTAGLEPLVPPTEDEERYLMGGTRYSEEHDGRYPFRLTVNGKRHLVEMPGLALDEVRFTGADDQNIWDFPRLFVDGSSWVWVFAVNVLFDENDETGDYGRYLGDYE